MTDARKAIPIQRPEPAPEPAANGDPVGQIDARLAALRRAHQIATANHRRLGEQIHAIRGGVEELTRLRGLLADPPEPDQAAAEPEPEPS